MQLNGADPYAWRRIVRRARLGSSVKLVAYALADYANPDGTRIHPGNERLVAVTELGDKTVRRALSALRDYGLIDRVVEGSKAGRRAIADEYRLTFPDDLMDRVPMLPPDEKPGSPVTVTCDEPVDNAGSPVTVTGHKSPDEPGTPVNDLRSPVTDTRNTGHGDRPPNHAPNHLSPNQLDNNFSDQQPEVEGAPHATAEDEKTDLESGEEEKDYRAANAILGRLPDLGAEFMTKAQAECPEENLRRLVITAARLAKGIPA